MTGVFIKTCDMATRDKLIRMGLTQIPSNVPTVFTFINPSNVKFSNEIKTKISFSNKLAL